MTHISKDEFFIEFSVSYMCAINIAYIRGGFQGARVIPHNREAMILEAGCIVKKTFAVESLFWHNYSL